MKFEISGILFINKHMLYILRGLQKNPSQMFLNDFHLLFDKYYIDACEDVYDIIVQCWVSLSTCAVESVPCSHFSFPAPVLLCMYNASVDILAE